MSLGHGASIIRDSLILHLDAANIKSYSGSGTVWNDLSGNGNHGTLVNGVGYSTDNKGAMVFDGANDYVSLPHVSITDKLTVSGFVSINSTRAWQTVIGNWNSTGPGDSWLFLSSEGSASARPAIYVRNPSNSGGTFLASTISLNLNTYYYLTGVFDSGKLQLYINANLIGEIPNVGFTSVFQNTQELWIGRFSNFYSTGSIAQVSVYNTALSEIEIQQNFNAIRGRYGI